MAPWTRHLIEAQVEKVTVRNYDECAQRIVALLDSRSTVQRLAVLLVRQANRWYAPSFHRQLDVDKRNLCDNFVGSIVHALALRVKPIKDVPTPEGLSGIPLLKADLLSVWIYRRMSIGPMATALYNSRNLSIDDLKVVIRACLEVAYTAKASNLGDALLLLEHGGRELDENDPKTFTVLFDHVKKLFHDHKTKATKRVQMGDRTLPSLLDRWKALDEKRQKNWRVSPYGADNQSFALDQGKEDAVQDNGQEDRTPAPGPNIDSDDGDSSMPRTPTSERDHGDLENLSRQNTADTMDAMWNSSHDSAQRGTEKLPVSPWSAYFATRESGQARPSLPANFEPQSAPDDPSTPTVATSREDSLSLSRRAEQSGEGEPQVQMEIMARQFPSDLMTSRRSSIVSRRPSVARDVHPSQSDALAFGKAAAEQQSSRSTTASHASTSRRRRVNSDRGGETSKDSFGKGRQLIFPSVQAKESFQNGPRRASEAQAVHSAGHDEDVEDRALLPISDTKVFPASLRGDATWIQLDTPEPFGIRIRFPPDFRIGDAQHVARQFAQSLNASSLDPCQFISASNAGSTIHFTPSGSVVQDFTFGNQDVFVEFPPSMTLAQASSVGHRLAATAAQIAI